mgnify:CR=1 FL=1
MNGDRMTPDERYRALINGDPVDRVPVFPLSVGHAAIVCGYPNLGTFYEKPEVSYACQRVAKELYGFEQPYWIIPPSYGAVEWGSKILFPYNPKMGSIAVIKPAVNTPEDVERLEVPDPKTAPYFKEMMDVLKKMVARKEFFMVSIMGGWITHACPRITSVENFMRWLIYEPPVAKKLLAKSREYALRMAEYYVRELGAESFIAFDAAPTDSNVLISPKQFEEFTLPSVVELHEKVLKMGVPMYWTHWCSNHNGNIKAGHVDKVPLGKPGIIHFGPEVDLKTVVERFGKRNVVLGNIDPPSFMMKSHDEVIQLARQDIEKGKNSPRGYILGIGCEMPPRAPPANVYALIKAAREYGKY